MDCSQRHDSSLSGRASCASQGASDWASRASGLIRLSFILLKLLRTRKDLLRAVKFVQGPASATGRYRSTRQIFVAAAKSDLHSFAVPNAQQLAALFAAPFAMLVHHFRSLNPEPITLRFSALGCIYSPLKMPDRYSRMLTARRARTIRL